MCLGCFLDEQSPAHDQEISMLDLAFHRITEYSDTLPDEEGEVYGVGRVVAEYGMAMAKLLATHYVDESRRDGLSPVEAVQSFGASMFALGMGLGVSTGEHYPQIPRTDYPDQETATAYVAHMKERMEKKTAEEMGARDVPPEIMSVLKEIGLVPEDYDGKVMIAKLGDGKVGVGIQSQEEDDPPTPGLYL